VTKRNAGSREGASDASKAQALLHCATPAHPRLNGQGLLLLLLLRDTSLLRNQPWSLLM
jgi:hypothetical protein